MSFWSCGQGTVRTLTSWAIPRFLSPCLDRTFICPIRFAEYASEKPVTVRVISMETPWIVMTIPKTPQTWRPCGVAVLGKILDVKIFYVFGVSLNKTLARFNFRAHQNIKNFISFSGISNSHLLHYSMLRRHSCLPKLLWVHLP